MTAVRAAVGTELQTQRILRRRRRIFRAVLAGLLVLAPAQAFAQTQTVTLVVTSRDALPGFRREDTAQFLAQEMEKSGVPGWHFAAAPAPAYPPRNRIEWHFELDPYAGGGVRQFFPMPAVKRLFGARHLITAEAMLYLDDEYQTLMFGQATVQGGAADPDLAAFVARMTDGLLGAHGAYRGIDLSPAANRPRP
jgi:hypothetical protein